ncbi:MAG: metalloregulator ArsR/SmtB family transcription factor [Rhodospirillales bacterium]|nr:metalloregulator ArsR/SmtB family transcription factor [Rhodospirillales bacterium]
MDPILLQLRAAADRTRMRILALASACDLCVADFADVLGQSQPRVSRHLGVMVEAGLLERHRESKNVFFRLAPTGLAQELAARITATSDETVAADRRAAQRVMAERAREATELFRLQGASWDEMRALGLAQAEIERAVLERLPPRVHRLLDIGTGTGRMLQVIGARADTMLGIDASRAMLALARTNLAEQPGLRHAAVRLGDMYRLELPDGYFDTVLMQMVLHYATEPARALAEAVRVLAPGGTLIVVDLARHERQLLASQGHHWLGFDDAGLRHMLPAGELEMEMPGAVPGELETRIWVARRRESAAPTEAGHTVDA